MPCKPITLSLIVLLLAGCRTSSPPADTSSNQTQKTYTVRGKVISTDATHVDLDAEEIPGYMEAMEMPYKLKDPGIVSELHPGDRITAKLIVTQDASGDGDSVLDNIVVVGQARPDYKPSVNYHVPQAGDTVPDFKLRNQSDRIIHLEQFKGKLLLVTFVYTRCPLPDFCVRMSRNFADIDKALAADPSLYNQTHLLSISFDPAYDTPKVLRSYGGAYTGNYTKETFAHWDFAVPSEKDLPTVNQFFNVGVTPGDNKSINHSLSTVLIGKDGKIVAWYPGNDWQPSEVLAQIKKSAAA